MLRPPDLDDELRLLLTWLCMLAGLVLVALLNGVSP